MNLDHLKTDETGWGYLPDTPEVFDILTETIRITEVRKLLEIGFYAGHSTSYWAELMPKYSKIISCCPDHSKARECAPIVMKKYPRKVIVHLIPSPDIHKKLKRKWFDLAFIDGNHSNKNVIQDTVMCDRLEIPYRIYDNVEWKSIRKIISNLESMGDIEIVREFSYMADFKGKVSRNQMTLVKKL